MNTNEVEFFNIVVRQLDTLTYISKNGKEMYSNN